MAELFTRKWQSEGRMVGRYVYSPVGYTEDDVRRLAEYARTHAPLWVPRPDAVKPFLHLLDGGDRAKA